MLIGYRLPQPPLSAFVQTFWFHQDLTTSHSMERVLPDGGIQLIFNLTDTPQHTYGLRDLKELQTYRDSWISGPHSRSIVIQGARRSCMFGIHFRPGGLFPFLEFPVSELNDSVIDLEDIWGGFAREVRHRLLEAESNSLRLDILEKMLLRRARDLRVDRTLAYAVQRITSRPEEVVVKVIAADTGISHRHLIRKFSDKVGLKPKALARVCRFNQVLRAVQSEQTPHWASVAGECGYFDQAHMYHDFQEMAGMTPSRYLLDRVDDSNFVPIR